MASTVAADATVDRDTARLVDEMQERFPLVSNPYAALGERIGLDPQEAYAKAAAAFEGGIVRQVGPIYDTRALGYSSSLVALKVAPDQIDRATAVLNAHPGVSHNYLRNHDFNVWYTLAVPPNVELESVVTQLAELIGAESSLPLPTLRLYKIGMSLNMTGDRRSPWSRPAYTARERDRALRTPLEVDDIAVIRESQHNWALSPDPFDAIARALGWSEAEVLRRLRALHTSGHLRRFAAIVNHRKAGFQANGMTVWTVPEQMTEVIGKLFASRSEVTHCYLRPTYPDWPYNIFAMIHGRSKDQVSRVVKRLVLESGIDEPLILYSTVELKKQRLVYFTPDHDQWWELCSAAAEEAS